MRLLIKNRILMGAYWFSIQCYDERIFSWHAAYSRDRRTSPAKRWHLLFKEKTASTSSSICTLIGRAPHNLCQHFLISVVFHGLLIGNSARWSAFKPGAILRRYPTVMPRVLKCADWLSLLYRCPNVKILMIPEIMSFVSYCTFSAFLCWGNVTCMSDSHKNGQYLRFRNEQKLQLVRSAFFCDLTAIAAILLRSYCIFLRSAVSSLSFSRCLTASPFCLGVVRCKHCFNKYWAIKWGKERSPIRVLLALQPARKPIYTFTLTIRTFHFYRWKLVVSGADISCCGFREVA